MIKYTSNDLYWIAIASVYGISPKNFYSLIAKFPEPEELIYAIKKGNSVPGINIEQRKNIYDNILHKEDLIENIHKNKTKVIVKDSEYYPPLLNEILDPPPVLFVRGDETVLTDENVFSIVGTRNSTRYGNEMARRIACELAENGITVVSGMARGIDTMSHWGALQGKGKTIAVLGSGIDVVYPPENEELYQEIIKSGAVVSEYFFGINANAHHFPIRNRIISGISRGVLVVEADETSGSGITVNYATQQGRDVFAVPGNVNSYASKGTNRLIKEGACLIRNASDILIEYNDWKSKADDILPTPDIKPLPTDEKEILIINILRKGETSFDELVGLTNIETRKLAVLLTELNFRGLIVSLPGNKFALDV